MADEANRAERKIAEIADILAATHSPTAMLSWHKVSEREGLDGIDPPLWWQHWHDLHNAVVGIPPHTGPSGIYPDLGTDDKDDESFAAFQKRHEPLWDRLLEDGVNDEPPDTEWELRAALAKALRDTPSTLEAALMAKHCAVLWQDTFYMLVDAACEGRNSISMLARFLGETTDKIKRWRQRGREAMNLGIWHQNELRRQGLDL